MQFSLFLLYSSTTRCCCINHKLIGGQGIRTLFSSNLSFIRSFVHSSQNCIPFYPLRAATTGNEEQYLKDIIDKKEGDSSSSLVYTVVRLGRPRNTSSFLRLKSSSSASVVSLDLTFLLELRRRPCAGSNIAFHLRHPCGYALPMQRLHFNFRLWHWLCALGPTSSFFCSSPIYKKERKEESSHSDDDFTIFTEPAGPSCSLKKGSGRKSTKKTKFNLAKVRRFSRKIGKEQPELLTEKNESA